MKNYWLFALLLIGLFTACDDDNDPLEPQETIWKVCLEFGPGQEDEIETAFLSMVDSTKIILKAGNYSFEGLSLDGIDLVLVQGAGQGATFLDFSSQTSGGEGIRVTNTDNITLRGLTLLDSKGDLLKLSQCDNVVIADVATIWTTDFETTNGGYGIYPVLCTNVLIDSCFAQGASDAGIYVGQTDNAIVRNSSATKNVAGCEIENTTNAEVYDNDFYNNTAGFLAFDLPGLSKRGGDVIVRDNYIHNNNLRNFAPTGSIVAVVPPGTGILHLAMSDVEYYDNRIQNNNCTSFLIATGLALDEEQAVNDISANYYPFPQNVYIHDNTMSKSSVIPQSTKNHEPMGQLLDLAHTALFFQDPVNHAEMQHIILDGYNSSWLDGHDTIPNPDNHCFDESENFLFIDFDLEHAEDLPNWSPSIDVSPYQVCL